MFAGAELVNYEVTILDLTNDTSILPEDSFESNPFYELDSISLEAEVSLHLGTIRSLTQAIGFPECQLKTSVLYFGDFQQVLSVFLSEMVEVAVVVTNVG